MGAVPGSRALRLVLVVSLALCGTAPLARAQEKASPTEARRREASEHVQRGDALKESGDHAAAAREYQKAYALVPHPVLIFNLAQVYRLGGDRERAIEHYERYLVADPNGRASRQARQFADQLRRELERERTGGEQAGTRAGSRSGQAPAGTTTVSRSAERPTPGRGLRLGGMVSAGAGLVAIGIGVKFGLDARGISDDIDAHTDGEWPEELLARQADGERAERNMFILTGAGAAALVAGGVLYYFGQRARREGEDPAVAVTPVTGGGLGVVFSGEF